MERQNWKSWSDRSFGCIRIRLVLEIAKEVVFWLESARDRRTLASLEEDLRQELKLKLLGLASLQRTIARHESRLLWLSDGDAPTRFFHIQANARRRKKFIRLLEHEGQDIVDEQGKADLLFSFFDELLGAPPVRSHDIALENLNLPCPNLEGLGVRFSEEEVWGVISALLRDKVPCPDGFSAWFLQTAWDIIRPDLMRSGDLIPEAFTW
jgi:hypothetical protein